jgi:bis(5'-nucleosyl)-tetraphosphatase (symmetrical)
MSTYAIGDLQGCLSELRDLLDKINFDEANDQLWFVGDIVNRGPESLACLRFVKSLGSNAKTVLGNHDLHLLALANNVRKPHRKDTLNEIINAEDSEELLAWVKQQPLLITDTELKFSMIHAGLPPQWTIEQAKELARETEVLLQSHQFDDFIHDMYGNKPDIWSESLKGNDRYRFIINCFTRMRYIDINGKLDLKEKCPPGSQSSSLIPWYEITERKSKLNKIIFGHWSTVHLGNDKNIKKNNIYPIDTGCLWGRKLTAIRLEDEKLFSVPSQQPMIHTDRSQAQ